MTPSLLREYVALVMEKIRTKKGQKGIMGSRFDLKKFKSLDNYHAALGYAQKFLDMLGQGSSRAAFMLSNKYVVKIALNEKGVGQNRAEVDVYTNPESKPVVAKVFDAHPDYIWVIAEAVRPLKSPQEFEETTGVDWETFCEYVNDGIKDQHLDKGAPKFIRAVVATALKNNLLRGDLAQQDFSHTAEKDVLDHYGKAGDGRIVLLDYGFTHEVWASHYRSGQEAMRGKTADSKAATGNREPSKDTDIDVSAKTAMAQRGKSAVDAMAKTKQDTPQSSDKQPTGKRNVQKTAPAAPKKKAAGDDEDLDKTRR
jgi:hypothetical protein